MKYHIQGKGQVDLTQKHFITAGGEGQIFAQGATAFKVYTDPKKMIPTAKIQELASLIHPQIIKPESVLLDAKNNAVGYTMKYVKDTYALCQLFTKSFRDRNKITPDDSLALVRKLQDIVQHVHKQKILIVDLNELNFLTSDDFKDIYAIDVDSYKTPSFPATALMESVRDRHSKGFSEATDWFAFALVSFQLYIGIHPYKGKHPTIKSMDDRMTNNISVLNKDVGIPAVCYPLSVIPPVYLDWYRAVLENGARLPPPDSLQAVGVIVQTINKLIGSNNFDIQEIGSFKGNVWDVFFSAGLQVTQTDQAIYMGRDSGAAHIGYELVTSPKCNVVVGGTISKQKLKLYNVTARQEVAIDIEADGIMRYDNRLYVKNGAHILELNFSNETVGGKDLLVTTNTVANVVERATKLYDGIAFQNLLGACWASFFPESGSHHQIRMTELDDYKIIEAKFDNGVLMVVGSKQGKYDKLIFRFDFPTFDVRMMADISPTGLNFIVMDNGICVHLTEEENIEIFSKKKNSPGLKIIDDVDITGDMKLFKMGTKVMVAKDNKIYSMTMKKP